MCSDPCIECVFVCVCVCVCVCMCVWDELHVTCLLTVLSVHSWQSGERGNFRWKRQAALLQRPRGFLGKTLFYYLNWSNVIFEIQCSLPLHKAHQFWQPSTIQQINLASPLTRQDHDANMSYCTNKFGWDVKGCILVLKIENCTAGRFIKTLCA